MVHQPNDTCRGRVFWLMTTLFWMVALDPSLATAQSKPSNAPRAQTTQTATLSRTVPPDILELARYLSVLENLETLENYELLELLPLLEEHDER